MPTATQDTLQKTLWKSLQVRSGPGPFLEAWIQKTSLSKTVCEFLLMPLCSAWTSKPGARRMFRPPSGHGSWLTAALPTRHSTRWMLPGSCKSSARNAWPKNILTVLFNVFHKENQTDLLMIHCFFREHPKNHQTQQETQQTTVFIGSDPFFHAYSFLKENHNNEIYHFLKVFFHPTKTHP